MKSPTSAVFSVMAVVCTIGRAPDALRACVGRAAPDIHAVGAVREQANILPVVRVGRSRQLISEPGVAIWSSP